MIDKLYVISEILKSEAEKMSDLSSEYKSDIFIRCVYDVKKLDSSKKYCICEEKTDSIIKFKKDVAAIYIFYSDTKILFDDVFDSVKYGAKSNKEEPNSKDVGVFYLGKTFDVATRLRDHFGDKDKTPYSLKYNHISRIDKFQPAKLYVFQLSESYTEYRNLILSTIESRLHEICCPAIGSKRV
jgi:hypothetical protein